MGRGKVTLKYIQNKNDRKISFGQRMEGLTKKVSKFSSNFGVESCLIVHDGDATRPMTWPQDSTTIQTMLKKYEHQKFVTAAKIFDVRDYFANKKNKAQDEITRVRKQIAMYKYPPWSPFFKVMGEEQIKVFIGIVDAKIKACNQRINMLKNMQQSENISARIMDDQEKIDVVHNVPQMRQNFFAPVKAINEMVDLTNHVRLPPVLATNKHEEWINQLFRLDDWIKELHKDYISGMVDFTNDVYVQQGEISFMLNTAQANVISSHSSQQDVMHNIPKKQHFDELAALEDFLMAEPEQECDPQLCGKVLLELNDLMGEPEDCDTKLDVPLVSSTNQLDVMHNIPKKQHISDDPIKQLNNVINVDVPHVSSTKQIDELAVLEDFLMAEPEQECDPQLCGKVLLELNDLLGEPEDCDTKLDVPFVSSTTQLGGVLELDNLVGEDAKPNDGDTEVVDFEDNANWVSQPDVFGKQGLSLLSKNQQH
ncbi:unnamed protein product [Trifolium pratense]|uniref:Uncharacterized protein n=1 Tax=Trifolium pratense TaxID=57577 RepID=A0ACB0JJC3_TRIPR|nr:unnamed protein product [Trifolium pratense]